MKNKKLIAMLALGVLSMSTLVACQPQKEEAPQSEEKESEEVDTTEDSVQSEEANTDVEPEVEGESEGATDENLGDVVDDVTYLEEDVKAAAVATEMIATIYNGEMPMDGFADIPVYQLVDMTKVNDSLITGGKAIMPMMNTNVDTIIILKSTDVESTKASLLEYKDSVIATRDPEQGGFPYLPNHLPKAQEAAVEIIGDYVIYVSLGNTDAAESDEEMVTLIQKDIATAVELAKASL